ncbi:hypothetical protein [Pyruvatibacter sp.]
MSIARADIVGTKLTAEAAASGGGFARLHFPTTNRLGTRLLLTSP